MKYKKYFRKTSLKQKSDGAFFLEEIKRKKPKFFLEVGVFHGVTARNICELLFEIHNNDFKYDYGPTVILEHKISTYKFYTLYGHLSKKCLKKLKVGQSINKGDWIG